MINLTENHYNETYFAEHYGRFISNDDDYSLLSKYWKKAIFTSHKELSEFSNMQILDYGAGTGVVTAALKNAACYDVAEYSRNLLRARGRHVYNHPDDIPSEYFDVVLCSHSLEHYDDPKRVVESFRGYVRLGGYLVLILPIENDFSPRIVPDNNQHLYCWNFQSISNLLRVCGWTPGFACEIYGPFMLHTLGRVLSSTTAVDLAFAFGRVKRGFRSMLVLSQNSDYR
jgi:ubiquinone/menaquinone biosynthesis C-methylase UbiE